ncbi:MAG TPA: CCA tRNA nucleotidyltransferase [Bacillota bacterium]|nr:CCA tRNA nucleotidyltransferase [Bacillota bacterium]
MNDGLNINPNHIPQAVTAIINTLQTHGFPSFLVGGCVRDLLLGKAPKDYDICTKAKPEEVKALFPKVIDTGIKYGTVTVLMNELAVEVTTYRKVVTYAGGPRASMIEYGSDAREDVVKRDFTINGLLFDGSQVVDYVQGIPDIRQGLIRAIEAPAARFTEDPLRMMRAVRFCSQLGFELEASTLEAITAEADLITRASPERIRDELVKILLSDRPAAGLRLLYRTGLLKWVLPELERCQGFNQRNPRHSLDVFDHTLAVVENVPGALVLRLAALLHDVGKPLTFSVGEDGIGHFYGHDRKSSELAVEILSRLRFDHKTIDSVALLVKEHMRRLQSPSKSALKRLINRVGAELVFSLLDLQIADIKRPETLQEAGQLEELKNQVRSILDENEPIGFKALAINGHDLKTLGINPGVQMKEILSFLLEQVIDHPELNNRERLLEIVTTNYLHD